MPSPKLNTVLTMARAVSQGSALYAAVFLGAYAMAEPPAFTGVSFVTSQVTGVGIADQNSGPGIFDQYGVGRRDPSDVIRLHDQYYVFYSKMLRDPNGPDDPTPHPQPGFPTGYYADIWYATSKNGVDWTEQGQALDRGLPGTWDSRSVFTPNVLLGMDGELYLYYTGVDEDGGPYNNHNPFNNDSVYDITQIGAARLAMDELGLVTSWERLNDHQPILSPTYDPAYSGGPAPFDSYRIDDAAMLVRDFNGDGIKEYGLYYKGRAQGGGPEGTQMGLAISDRPDRGFVRIHPDGSSIQSEGHEVTIWAQGEGVASFATGNAKGIWYAEDAIEFQEITESFTGSPRTAPGAYRPELVDHDYQGGVQWGIRHASPNSPYLASWREVSGGFLSSKQAGDLNGDGEVGMRDLDLLLANWQEQVAFGSHYDGDLSGDGFVGHDDFELLYRNWSMGAAPQSIGGDFDGNGIVDELDYPVWKSTFGSSGNTAGDGNYDGAVTLADYTIWRDNLGRHVPILPPVDPEPESIPPIHISVGESATITNTAGHLTTADLAPGTSGSADEQIANSLGNHTWNNIAWNRAPQLLKDGQGEPTTLTAFTGGAGEFVDARFDATLGADIGSTLISAHATQGTGIPSLVVGGFGPNETAGDLWFYHLVDDSTPRGTMNVTINGIPHNSVPVFATTGMITIFPAVQANDQGELVITSSNYIVGVSIHRAPATDLRFHTVPEPTPLSLAKIALLCGILCRTGRRL